MDLNNALNEKEILNDLIISEKQLLNYYNDAIVESFSPSLFTTFIKCINNIQDIGYSLNKAINQRGWSNIKLANKRDIKEIIDRFDSLQ